MTAESVMRQLCWKATEAVHDATEAVQATTRSIAGALEAGRRPGGWLGQLARLTREAPLSLSQTLSGLAVDRESDDDRVQ
jgi:hypothetical protein